MPHLVNKNLFLFYVDKLEYWILTCLLQQKFLHLLTLKISGYLRHILGRQLRGERNYFWAL